MHALMKLVARLVALLVMAVCTFAVSAASTEVRVLFDVDNEAATGCAMSGMVGVDQVLVIELTDDLTSASVKRTYRQLCVADSLGTPVDVNTTERPAGWQPANGDMIVETAVPYSMFGAAGNLSPMRAERGGGWICWRCRVKRKTPDR